MRAKPLFVAVTVIVILALAAEIAAQDTKPVPNPSEKVTAYRLDFSVNELEDGKKVNERRYSMNLVGDSNPANPGKELKIGSRVPVESEQGKFQYLDVGTNIWSRLYPRENSTSLDVRVEISNFALPDQARGGGQPVVRQMVISGSTLLILDKPLIIGSVDDPNSKRQFQLEVLATKIK
jgi:hypothetical protein